MNAMPHQPRLERLRRRMEEAGIDVMLCLKPENSFYLTGFNPIIYSHPVVAILPREGKASMLVHALRDDHARASTFLEDIRLYGAWSTKVTMGPSWLEALKTMLTEGGFAEAVVGIEEDFLPMTRYRELQGILPGARFADVSQLVFQTRLIKDADEIANARAAAAIADVGMYAAVDAVGQGGNEREIAITSMAAMNRYWAETYPDAEVCDFGSLEGGVQNGLWTWVFTHERIFMNCDNPTLRRPAKGEPVFIDIWTIVNGIHAENERTVAVGTLPDEIKRAIDSIISIRESIVPLIQPGTPISELYAKARRGLEENGYGRFLPGRIGHGIGLGAHEGPSLDSKTSFPLEPGMLLTLEPNLRMPGVCGTQISDTVLVTETGCEFLTRSPNGLLQV